VYIRKRLSDACHDHNEDPKRYNRDEHSRRAINDALKKLRDIARTELPSRPEWPWTATTDYGLDHEAPQPSKRAKVSERIQPDYAEREHKPNENSAELFGI
jgi:hypothetical protein